MGQHNDSINQHIPRAAHDAINHVTLQIIKILEEHGINTARQIDFHPSTGEVIMSEKTKLALRDFQRQLTEKGITIDKVMHGDKLQQSGYYVIQGRSITPKGIILSEGECIGFVPLEVVDAPVDTDSGCARGVLV